MRKTMRMTIFALMSAILLFPSWLMISNSFSPAKAFLRSPPRLLPYTFTTENYQRAFASPLLPRWIVNTLLLVGSYVVLGVIVNGAAGYAFCFARAAWLRGIFWVLMLPIFVSRYVILISQIRILGILHLSGLVAVLSMSLCWATGIYLFRNYFRSIPPSIVESARIDGAGEWTILLRVVLPMSGPIIGAAIVFLGMGALGDYVFQMLVLQTSAEMTYLVGLMSTTFHVLVVKNIGYDLTVGTLLFLPYLALFAFSSRYFIGGLTGGSLKE